ncbi:MAG: hypothetical protein WED00_01965 [Aquisalimonadaceae bacterium]
MPTSHAELFFHIVRQPTTLRRLSSEIYPYANHSRARDFVRVNMPVAGSNGQLQEGQLVFLPEACFRQEAEDVITETLVAVNNAVLHEMDSQERRMLADSYDFLDNLNSNPDTFDVRLEVANSTASTLSAVMALEMRLLGDLLKDLESKYVDTFRAHGRMTPEFFEYRRRVYRMLDTHLGRVISAVGTQSPFALKARNRLNINTRSQIRYWSRHGTAGGVRDFQRHFGNVQRAQRWLRNGGYVGIALGGGLTYRDIKEACEVGDEADCRRETVVRSSEFGGSVAGAAGGSALAYTACSFGFSYFSLATSFIWCGLVAGAAGSAVGGYGMGKVGKALGTGAHDGSVILYERFAK